MNTFKRILSGILSAALAVGAASMISVGAANISFTDVSEHWAWTNGQIPYLVEKGVLNGYEQANGTYMFKPDGNVKRSEFIKMLDEVFGLSATTSISYSDVPSSEWYYSYFQKAAAQGYILDYGSTANPTGEITREEAAALLVRYLDLPADEKAEASTFSDYSAISANYREYVLRAVYAGIINGYNEDGKTLFKPQKTLTRAEALTILYRAAGCIFNESASSRSGKAASTNNTITDTDITVNNIIFNGRNIITEGASGGRITFTGCTFNGTLYVRGTTAITFNDCNIENLVLLGGGNITLVSGTEVDTVSVEKSTAITSYAGTEIGELTIEYGADFSKVSGDGSIDMAYIRAREFASSVIPTEFEIGNNLTAYFDETSFQGTSDAQNPFSIAPFITANEYAHILNLITNADGQIYYYYTNLASAPSVSAFDSYYDSAEKYGSFEVKSGEAVSEETLPSEEVTNFEYMVVQLQYGTRKYAPVIIDNIGSAGTGFKTEPYVYDATTIKFQSETSGTLYWFYADDGKQLSQLDFLNAYNNKESALKGTTELTSVKSFTCTLKEKYLENYSYVAFMLVSGGDTYHNPVIVSVGDDGFTDAPIIKTPGVITFKSSVDGDIFYYYSATRDLPTADNFKSQYNNADEKDNAEIEKNVETILKYDLDEIEDYPYLIMAIRDEDDNYMLPVALDINYTTGFRNDPVVKSSTEISLRTRYEGSIKYYYTKSDIAPTSDTFLEAYDDQTSKYKGSKDVSTFYETITYDSGYAANYPYMAIMFTDEDDKQYSPVIVALDATMNTGFSIVPYAKDGTVYLHVEEDGEVWYFYTKDGDAVAPDDFEEEYDSTSSKRKNTMTVEGDSVESFTIDEEILEDYPYIVIAFTEDDSNPDFAFPFVLDVAYSETSNAGSGLKVSEPDNDDEVKVELLYDGDLYWYCTDDKDDLPSTQNDFERKYNSASESDRYRNLDEGDYKYLKFYDHDYLVFALKSGSEFLSYVVVHIEDGIEKDDTNILTDYDKSSYGFTFDGWNKDEMTVIAKEDGKIELFVIRNGNKETIDTENVSEGAVVSFDTPATAVNDILGELFGDLTFAYYLQFTDDDGSTYKPYHLTQFN